MIRILRHTLCLALLLTLAACEKDREPRIEVSTGEIHLPGDASSGTTFTVSAEEPWTLSYTGEGFAVTPDGGARGSPMFSLYSAACQNNSSKIAIPTTVATSVDTMHTVVIAMQRIYLTDAPAQLMRNRLRRMTML